MPRCEKCGYPRATIQWCTSCGSQNPYPRRKWLLRGALIASLLAIITAGSLFARKAAFERTARTTAEAKSFRVEREAKLIATPAKRQ
jgi:hypothetical protein